MPVLQNHVLFNHLKLQLRAVSDWHRSADFSIKKMLLPCTMVWYVVSGSKKIEVNGNPLILSQGDLLILPPHTMFQAVKRREDGLFHHLSLTAQLKVSDFDVVKMYRFPCRISVSAYSESMRTLKGFWYRLVELADQTSLEEDSGETAPRFKKRDLISQFAVTVAFHQWLQALFALYEPQLSDGTTSLEPRVLEVSTYIQRHLDHKLDIADLSRQVYISPGHLRELFQKHLQCSPMAYVRRMRMQYARELLLTSRLPIKEIARRCGFKDQSQFSKAFHKMAGMSPSDYRKEVIMQ